INKIRLQPLVQFEHDAVFGYEALYRREKGEVFPSAAKILESVIDARSYAGDFQLFINMTTQDIVDPNFYKSVLDILDKNCVDGSSIVLEVNESTNPNLLSVAKKTLGLLRRHNIKIALDDFGSEYSSLSFLNELPVDIIKMDKSFTQEAPSNRRLRSLLKFGTEVSHDLGCIVVAEGIETQEQLDCVKNAGVDIGQGFLFTAPFRNFRKKIAPFVELCEFAFFPINGGRQKACYC
ncbi:MAG: EAL domain-containing protein, partial [Holosporaceae bacterium]|nr:EAL domain-containing protein [Holosporaceae bacterium]